VHSASAEKYCKRYKQEAGVFYFHDDFKLNYEGIVFIREMQEKAFQRTRHIKF